MFHKGDIVKFVDRGNPTEPWFSERMKYIEDRELFIVIKSTINETQVLTSEDITLTLFSWRFILVAKKTKFGYMVI